MPTILDAVFGEGKETKAGWLDAAANVNFRKYKNHIKNKKSLSTWTYVLIELTA